MHFFGSRFLINTLNEILLNHSCIVPNSHFNLSLSVTPARATVLTFITYASHYNPLLVHILHFNPLCAAVTLM